MTIQTKSQFSGATSGAGIWGEETLLHFCRRGFTPRPSRLVLLDFRSSNFRKILTLRHFELDFESSISARY